MRTEHDTLKRILNLADAPSKLKRRRLQLSESEFYIVHRVGIKDQAADALLRVKTCDIDTTEVDDDLSERLGSIMEKRGEIINGD